MADPTKPATDLHNQPADQRLINDHPELLDPSLKGKVPGPQSTAPAPDRPAADDLNAPNTAGNDSKGQPRPHGQAGSDEEKAGQADARRQEQAQRGERVTPPGTPRDQAGKKR